MSYVARHRNARLEQFAFIGLVFDGDAHRNRLQALKARGWLKVSALLAAVQGRSTLWTRRFKVEPFGQQSGAVVASRSGDRLNHPRQSGAGNIQRWAGTWRARTLISLKSPVLGLWTVGVIVAPLPVLAVALHRMLVGLLLYRLNDAGIRWIQSGLQNRETAG
jgi:hypothetical protein